jgi:hypothetical protein
MFRLAVVLSRFLVACSVILLFFAAYGFLKTGALHPITLAETLAFYKVTVPDFGLPGLAQVYAFMGSISLFLYFLIIGLMIALASAKADPSPTKQVFRSIILFPVDATYFTLASFFLLVRSVIKYTFVTVLIVVAIAAAWWGYDYQKYAHRFAESPRCDLRQTAFGDITFNFVYRCFDAGGNAIDQDRRYYALFMASNRHPDRANTGHAWLALVALKKDGTSPNYLLTDYRVASYGMQGQLTATCLPFVTSVYLAVRPIFAFAAPIEPFWCLKGTVGNEGRTLHDPAGVPIPRPVNADAVDNMLGAKPEIVLAVSIGRDQFDLIGQIINDQTKTPKNYQLGLHDCTTFVRDVAEAIGLYVPPRILAAFPSQSIYAIMEYNLKRRDGVSS